MIYLECLSCDDLFFKIVFCEIKLRSEISCLVQQLEVENEKKLSSLFNVYKLSIIKQQNRKEFRKQSNVQLKMASWNALIRFKPSENSLSVTENTI